MSSVVTVLVSAQHPAFGGHFPGAPLLPGVVLLDEMLRVVEEARGGGAVAAGADSRAAGPGAGANWTIATAKFLQPVRPGDTLTVEHEALKNGAVRFAIRSGGRAVATGTLVPRLETTTVRDHGHQAG